MTTQEIADRLVKLLREGNYSTIYNDLFSTNVVSTEPNGTKWGEVRGLDAIAKKGEEFGQMVEAIHSTEISDPLVAESFITLTMKMSVTWKGALEPTNMDEICVYEVRDGKIAKEQFFYTPASI